MKWAGVGMALLWPALGEAGEEAPPVWRVRTEVQMISLPVAEGARLAPQFGRPAEFAVAYARVQGMLQSGQATLLGWPVTEGRAGVQALTASHVEVRYPTEFRPPDRSSLFSVESGSDPVFPIQSLPPAGTNAPTSFETREAGPNLQVDASVNAKTGGIELSLLVQYVRLTELQPAVGARPENPGGVKIEQPRFIHWSVKTSLTMPSGGGLLLSTFLEDGPRPRMVFFLLHAASHRYSAILP